MGLQSLTAEGVDVSHAEIVADARTQVAFILIDTRNGERTVIWHRDTRLAYSDLDAPVAVATRGTHTARHRPRHACVHPGWPERQEKTA